MIQICKREEYIHNYSYNDSGVSKFKHPREKEYMYAFHSSANQGIACRMRRGKLSIAVLYSTNYDARVEINQSNGCDVLWHVIFMYIYMRVGDK